MRRRAQLERRDALRRAAPAGSWRTSSTIPASCSRRVVFLIQNTLPPVSRSAAASRLTFGHRADGGLDRHRRVLGHHEAVLQIDHDQGVLRGSRSSWTCSLPRRVHDAVDGPLRHRELVHGALLLRLKPRVERGSCAASRHRRRGVNSGYMRHMPLPGALDTGGRPSSAAGHRRICSAARSCSRGGSARRSGGLPGMASSRVPRVLVLARSRRACRRV